MKTAMQPMNITCVQPGFAAQTTGGNGNDAQPELLPGVQSLLCSGDPGAMLAALTMQTAHDEAKQNRIDRDCWTKAEESEESNEIQALREKADLTRAQGIVGGALQVAQAGFSFGSSMKGLAADKLADSAAEASADGKSERDMVSNFGDGVNQEQRATMTNYAESREADARMLTVESKGVQQTATYFKGTADLAGACKTLSDGLFGGAITDKDTDSKAHDIAAQAFKKMADDAHDDEKDSKDLMSKALDFYKEYVDAKNQTAMAATHRA